MVLEIVIVCQKGTRITDSVRYGALRATVEMAKQLQARGHDVLLVGLGDRERGQADGVDCAVFENDRELRRFVHSLEPIPFLIGISRGDVLLMAKAGRYLVYQHGPHPPQGIDVTSLRLARVPIVCVSEASGREQIRYGLDADRVHVVYNGYDQTVFRQNDGGNRTERSLFYAGSIVGYKGVDIALNAFRMLKTRYPEATFHLCGQQHHWTPEESAGLPPRWVTEAGCLDWGVIGQDVAGVTYHGELSQEEVAGMLNRCSLLVMCSRVAEPCPLIVLEAQACGCIPVVPNAGGWPEIVAPELSGYLYTAPPDAERLVRHIEGVWESREPTDKQRLAARQWASGFSWNEAGSRFNGILNAVMPVRGKARTFSRISAVWHHGKGSVVKNVLKGWWNLMEISSPARKMLGIYRRKTPL